MNSTNKPMTTKEVFDMYGPDQYEMENATCSRGCTSCTRRIWFAGSWGDGMTPTRFACPYCKKTNHDPYML